MGVIKTAARDHVRPAVRFCRNVAVVRPFLYASVVDDRCVNRGENDRIEISDRLKTNYLLDTLVNAMLERQLRYCRASNDALQYVVLCSKKLIMSVGVVPSFSGRVCPHSSRNEMTRSSGCRSFSRMHESLKLELFTGAIQ